MRSPEPMANQDGDGRVQERGRTNLDSHGNPGLGLPEDTKTPE